MKQGFDNILVSKTFNKLKNSVLCFGHPYVEIGGVKWATMNVGANSVTDYGFYFQWGDTQGYTASQVGRGEGKKYFDGNWGDYKWTSNGGLTFTKYNDADGKTALEPCDDAAREAWGGNWRMPTTDEFRALGNAATTAWATDYKGRGVKGFVLTDKTDSSKELFFPACGLAYSGNVCGVGSYGLYWSNSTNDMFLNNAYIAHLSKEYIFWAHLSIRRCGFTVRGVFDA